MSTPIRYSVRSVFNRRLTFTFTVLGITLVAFVFAAVLMMSNGIKETLVASGCEDNVVVIREGSVTEMQSFVSREQSNIIETLPEIKQNSGGRPLVTGEVVVVININKLGTDIPANVVVRGAGVMSTEVHRGVNIYDGRMFELGQTEIIVGEKVADNYEGCQIGDILRFGNTDWTVVGLFESDGSAFESEIWGDVDQLMPAFGRPVFSSMTFTMNDISKFDEVRDRVRSDPRMTVTMKQEQVYYEEQSTSLRTFITILGTVISIVFSIGAIIGAMITMYAAVANRTTEIATLRALGFKRFNILLAFLVESLSIATIGGLLGLVIASLLSFVDVSTMNWESFSEITFSFEMSWEIVISVMIFAVVMGFVGGFLPAIRASRIKITEALRAE